jgi:hypothetical protein
MPDFAEPLARLIAEFKHLPGIGQKSAQRLAFHVLRAGRDDAERLSQAILDVKDKLGLCAICNNISDSERCQFCRDPNRDPRWSAWWKSRTTSWESKPRASSTAATTCCTARFRRCAASGRSR